MYIGVSYFNHALGDDLALKNQSSPFGKLMSMDTYSNNFYIVIIISSSISSNDCINDCLFGWVE